MTHQSKMPDTEKVLRNKIDWTGCAERVVALLFNAPLHGFVYLLFLGTPLFILFLFSSLFIDFDSKNIVSISALAVFGSGMTLIFLYGARQGFYNFRLGEDRPSRIPKQIPKQTIRGEYSSPTFSKGLAALGEVVFFRGGVGFLYSAPITLISFGAYALLGGVQFFGFGPFIQALFGALAALSFCYGFSSVKPSHARRLGAGKAYTHGGLYSGKKEEMRRDKSGVLRSVLEIQKEKSFEAKSAEQPNGFFSWSKNLKRLRVVLMTCYVICFAIAFILGAVAITEGDPNALIPATIYSVIGFIFFGFGFAFRDRDQDFLPNWQWRNIVTTFLITSGLYLLLLSQVMETSVDVPGTSMRVINIGLKDQSQKFLFLGGFFFIGGVILYATKDSD